jgi:hypothetical protein
LAQHLSQILSEKRAISGAPPENLFGETPNTTREDAYAPQTLREASDENRSDEIPG